MFLDDASKAVALDALFPIGTGADRCYLSAHTDYSASGANLHGSKVAGAWAATSAGSKSTTAAIDLSITAPVTIKWLGAWGGTAGNTFRGMQPNGSTGPKSFQVDLANNRIYCEGHGWSSDQKITFYGANPPTGLTAGTTYFVVSVTAGDPDYFQVAATAGGAAIDITGQAGWVVVSRQLAGKEVETLLLGVLGIFILQRAASKAMDTFAPRDLPRDEPTGGKANV